MRIADCGEILLAMVLPLGSLASPECRVCEHSYGAEKRTLTRNLIFNLRCHATFGVLGNGEFFEGFYPLEPPPHSTIILRRYPCALFGFQDFVRVLFAVRMKQTANP